MVDARTKRGGRIRDEGEEEIDTEEEEEEEEGDDEDEDDEKEDEAMALMAANCIQFDRGLESELSHEEEAPAPTPPICDADENCDPGSAAAAFIDAF